MLDKIKLLENELTKAKNDLRLAVLDYIKNLSALASEREGLQKTIVNTKSNYLIEYSLKLYFADGSELKIDHFFNSVNFSILDDRPITKCFVKCLVSALKNQLGEDYPKIFKDGTYSIVSNEIITLK